MSLPAANRIAYLDWLLKQAGKPVLWAEKGPDVFDCSGLVTCGLVACGVVKFEPRYTNTDKLWNTLPVVEVPRPGDLVFYGGTKPNDVDHVMVWWGDGRVYGACGATSRITTLRDAQVAGARVRFRKQGYRRDFRGYRRAPFDDPGAT